MLDVFSISSFVNLFLLVYHFNLTYIVLLKCIMHNCCFMFKSSNIFLYIGYKSVVIAISGLLYNDSLINCFIMFCFCLLSQMIK